MKQTAITMRASPKSIAAIAAVAAAENRTMKQVVFRALAAAGVPVEPADLEDCTPRRKAPDR